MTSKDIQDENAEEANPFIEELGPYINLKDWASKLSRDPLSNINRKSLSEEQRDNLLHDIVYRWEPTRDAIHIAQTLQRMMRRSYRRRNPLLSAERKRKALLLGVSCEKDVELLRLDQASPASAFIVAGCTGLGKSTSVIRFCEMLPQKISHRANRSAGWIQQVQIPYLIVPMPVHKGSFLFAILAALDAVLHTDFADKYRRWSIERLEIKVGVLLITYNVGMLLIEELQAVNFGESHILMPLLLMLLRLLNFGIPIVFIGNPLAFEGIKDHSQNQRRMHSEESVELMPLEINDPDWSEGLAPSLWGHNCMPEMTPCSPEIIKQLHKASAGIPYFASAAVVGAQQIALRSGQRRVLAKHLEQYRKESSAFAACRDLIEGFENHDPWRLSRFLDVPWERYGQMWGVPLEEMVKISDAPGEDTVTPMNSEEIVGLRSVHSKLRRRLHADLARTRRRAGNDEAVRNRLPVRSVRNNPTSVLSSNLNVLKERLQANSVGEQLKSTGRRKKSV
jgi:hypothetical protein